MSQSRRNFLKATLGAVAALPFHQQLFAGEMVTVKRTGPPPTTADEYFAHCIRHRLETDSASRSCLLVDELGGQMPRYQMAGDAGKLPVRIVKHTAYSFRSEPQSASEMLCVPYQEDFLTSRDTDGHHRAVTHYIGHENRRLMQLLRSVALPVSGIKSSMSVKSKLDVAFGEIEEQDQVTHNMVCSQRGLDWLASGGNPYTFFEGKNTALSPGFVATAKLHKMDFRLNGYLNNRIYFLGPPDSIGVIALWQDMQAISVKGKIITFYDPCWAAQPGFSYYLEI